MTPPFNDLIIQRVSPSCIAGLEKNCRHTGRGNPDDEVGEDRPLQEGLRTLQREDRLLEDGADERNRLCPAQREGKDEIHDRLCV